LLVLAMSLQPTGVLAQAPRSSRPAAIDSERPASTGPTTTEGLIPRAKYALYISGTSLLSYNGLGLNFGYRPFRGFAVSFGAGWSENKGWPTPSGQITAWGAQVAMHGLFGGESAHSFELAGGIGLVNSWGMLTTGGSFSFSFSSSSSSRTVDGLEAAPVGFIGYRYHPLDGGFLFRTGIGLELGYGMGLNLSFGGAF